MTKPFGLYLHIPFCKSKCPYCDFYSSCKSESEYDEYTDLLIEKIKVWSEKTNRPVSTIYIGGGTPSILGADRLCRILDSVKENFAVESNAEISVEINPDSGKTIDFSALKKCGFNRISVGMQSAVENELKALGRIHSSDDAKRTIERAKQCGITNISLDLMLGIPYQTFESLEKSINFCNECGVTHISSYILKIEKNTPFWKKQNELILPDEDTQADIYLNAVSILDKLGYKQYEISNFSKQGFESRHNTNYWKCGEYIGIGPSAHSFFEGKRFYYERSIDDFKNDKTVFDCYGGSEEEFIMLSLRLKSGLNFEEYKNKFGKDIPEKTLKKIQKYCKYGFMELNDKNACFTPKGFLVSNTILSDLV